MILGQSKKEVVEDNTLQLVTFQLGKERYGIDIMDVKQINGIEDVRPIPNAPVYVEGLFNLRGGIIPVINLQKRFHFEKSNLTEEEKLLSGFIIININNMEIGIMIDKILKVVTVDRREIQPPPQMISGIGSEYIHGVVNEEEGYLVILDTRRLFSRGELQAIDVMQS